MTTGAGARLEGMAVTGLCSLTVGESVVGPTVARVGLGVVEIMVGNSVGLSVVGVAVVGESVVGFKVGAALGGRVCAGSGGGVRIGGCKRT